MPITSIVPSRFGIKPEDRAQQHRLAAAGRADDAENFAALHIEREMIEHDLPAEPDHEIAHP